MMRIRHGLRLDEPDDFDIMTQDAILQLWDQISQATFLALIVISSIALMVGGIGVMAIMSISVTERTREIGVRKALGARRAEILFQFLMEAAFLTSMGGVLGIVLGAAIGWVVHLVSGFPISLPWWSFALGLGFSASVGIFFGMYPAFKASRLDPIEALRYDRTCPERRGSRSRRNPRIQRQAFHRQVLVQLPGRRGQARSCRFRHSNRGATPGNRRPTEHSARGRRWHRRTSP